MGHWTELGRIWTWETTKVGHRILQINAKSTSLAQSKGLDIRAHVTDFFSLFYLFFLFYFNQERTKGGLRIRTHCY